ncbi:hypothetical protein QYE76_022286 [Lolium multiflorum]|uniref:Reverse transcriptase Ty1/copia-type domain-containing protein n=1 Tax=Lolium multiflorum TaxID=4521 RepID=A0AAD8RCC8_LOLMU|nr:hypothetical protein QYE76_022286 [Lolium multiflorum]
MPVVGGVDALADAVVVVEPRRCLPVGWRVAVLAGDGEEWRWSAVVVAVWRPVWGPVDRLLDRPAGVQRPPRITVVREGDDARTVWGKINGLFTNNKLQRVVFLQQEFFGTPQGDQTLDAYCLRLKAISDELQDLGFRIGDELLLSTLTAGLSEDLGNAASNLTLMSNPTFERAVDYLRLEERRLKGVRTRAVHTALWASGNSVLPHGGGAPPAPTPAPPHPAPQPHQHQGGGGGGRGRRRGRGGNNGGPGIVGPRPGYSHPTPPWAGGHNPWTGVVHAYTMPVPPPSPALGPRPQTHQAFIAAPPQAPASLPYAPVYGGMMPQAPPAHWDPAQYTTLQHAPAPGAYSGGGDWFMDTGASHTWLLSRSAASRPYLGGGPWLGSAPTRSLYHSYDASRDALELCLGLTRGALEPRLGRHRLALDTARVALEHYLGHRRVILGQRCVLHHIALEPQLGDASPPAPPPPPPAPATPPVRVFASRARALPSPLPASARAALRDPQWFAAMHDEFDTLQRNKTWTLVPRPPHANIITGKWVFKHKFHPDGTLDRHKARWVVRGFRQRAGVDFTDTFAPVVKPGTICTVLQLAVSRAWPVHQMDVSNTFLHGHLEEQRIAAFLHQLGFRSTRSDASLFVYNNGNTTAYLLLYVDDIILTATSTDLLRQLTARLRAEFALKDLGPLHYFLGIEVVRRTDGFFLHQRKYAHELLDHAGMLNCKPAATPVDTKSKLSAIDGSLATDASSYRSIVDALQYLTLTRPSCRILRYIRGTMDFGLSLHASTAKDIVAYSDADWAGCPDTRRSTSATASTSALRSSPGRLSDSPRYLAPRRRVGLLLPRLPRSRLRQLLVELSCPVAKATVVYCDNVSAVYLSANPVHHRRTKHIELDIHFVR